MVFMTNPAQTPELPSTRSRVATGVRIQLAIAGISASYAARKIGMTQSTMSRRITGEYPFDVDELESLAEFLGVEVEDFFSAPAVTPRAGAARLSNFVAPPLGLEPRTYRLKAAGYIPGVADPISLSDWMAAHTSERSSAAVNAR